MKKKLTCVLFIDDDEPTNFLNKMITEEAMCAEHVQVVQSGQEALNYLSGSGHFKYGNGIYPKPELIFLDINMPAMDGWEFLDRYQELPEIQKENTVMVMLTTSLNPDDEKTAQKYPCIAGFEHKPFTMEILLKILKQNFSNHF